MRRFTCLFTALMVTAAALPCAAAVSVSLPLEGYHRAGRYMPVRVIVQGEPAGELTLLSDGAVTTMLQLNGAAADVIVPVLVVTEPLGPIAWSLPDGRKGTVETKLTALGDQDRLVGYSGGNAGAAAGLFAGKTIIPVALDLAEPLRAPYAAWETLDAAVLDRDPRSAALPAGGTAVVVRTAARPKANVLPFRPAGDAWVMSLDPLGPRDVIVPEAYDPTYGWHPGRLAAVRRQVVLIGVLFSVLAVAATLWRSRFAVGAVVGLCVVACGAIAYRSTRIAPVATARGTVVVRRGDVVQADRWDFYKSMAATTATYRPDPMARPVFASVQHFRRSGLHLTCRSDGQPMAFTFPLAREASMVFLARRVAALSGDRVDPTGRTSPLWPLVQDAYLGGGVRAAGERVEVPPASTSDQIEGWLDVVVDDESAR